MILQSPCSTDLNISDRFLNNWMKNELRSMMFHNSEEVRATAVQCFKKIELGILRHEVDKLMVHCDSDSM